jgi:hypothetical protein
MVWLTALATVVLPIPPGPTMVKKRRAASSSEISRTVSVRPTILVGLGGSPTGECARQLLKSAGRLAAREIGATKQ